jgi:hypothetical protein
MELVFRDYGRDPDIKAEELTAAFGEVAPLRLSPVWMPRNSKLY